MNSLSRYDWRESYEWNFEHAPEPPPIEVPPCRGRWDFCGLAADSPLGIAAGPLLNGRWIRYYAGLGFDVLTYKTVRSTARSSYPRPNLQPVDAVQYTGAPDLLQAAPRMDGTWAVSFGMPSQPPSFWRADIEQTRQALPRNKILNVSVVASPEPHWTAKELAADFAVCARWAIESGADSVEANFSCPNVASADGQIYQDPELARAVAAALREAVGAKPLSLKIGHITRPEHAARLVEAVADHVNALVMVNCISGRVAAPDGSLLFGAARRGIAGAAIRDACLAQVRLFHSLIRARQAPIRLVGVGGVGSAADVRAFLDAGCHSVQLATAAMLDPGLALSIRPAL